MVSLSSSCCKRTTLSKPVPAESFNETEFGGFDDDGGGMVSWDCRDKSTAEAEALLAGQVPGTFVLRGSGSAAATLCMVSKDNDIYRRQIVKNANGVFLTRLQHSEPMACLSNLNSALFN